MKSLDELRKKIAIEGIVQPPRVPVSDEELITILDEINAVQPLLAQGLLRQKEFEELYKRASSAYENTVDQNSIQYRKYDKARRQSTIWREVPTSGYVDEDKGWRFTDIKQQIIELLQLKEVKIPSKEVFLKPNSEYDALVIIKNILSQATTAIDIKDDYLFTIKNETKNITLLNVLRPYLDTSLEIKVRLLGLEKELPVASPDVNAFLAQFRSKVSIKGVVPGKDNRRESHDRFIIIDGKNVYNIGGSIKDLGKSQTSITELTDSKVCQQFISQFDKWWGKASDYIENN